MTMLTSLLIVALAGLITGFVLTIPVAGPVSIYITSQGLKGYVRYCTLTAIGAAIVDFIYCFTAVYGLTQLYQFYYPLIPYFLLTGGLAVLLIGLRIFRKSLPANVHDSNTINEKIRHHNALITGFMLNFLNPTLFVGWLISSFVVLSFVASLGFNLGGIDHQLQNNISAIQKYEEQIRHHTDLQAFKDSVSLNAMLPVNGSRFALSVSLTFAFFLALGTVIWFYVFSVFLKKKGKLFNPQKLSVTIKFLGLAMSGFGIYITGKAAYYLYLIYFS